MTTERTSGAPVADRTASTASPETNGSASDGSPIDHLKEAAAKVAEAKDHASILIAAKLDSLKLSLRKLAVYAVLGVVAALIAVGGLITGVVLLLSGFSGLIGELFPEKWEHWGGPLVVGLLVVGGALGGTLVGMKLLTGSSRKRTIEKYENRKRDQRIAYGHDVAQRAREHVERQ